MCVLDCIVKDPQPLWSMTQHNSWSNYSSLPNTNTIDMAMIYNDITNYNQHNSWWLLVMITVMERIITGYCMLKSPFTAQQPGF